MFLLLHEAPTTNWIRLFCQRSILRHPKTVTERSCLQTQSQFKSLIFIEFSIVLKQLWRKTKPRWLFVSRFWPHISRLAACNLWTMIFFFGLFLFSLSQMSSKLPVINRRVPFCGCREQHERVKLLYAFIISHCKSHLNISCTLAKTMGNL